jgi:hypothetical protein
VVKDRDRTDDLLCSIMAALDNVPAQVVLTTTRDSETFVERARTLGYAVIRKGASA